MEKGALQDGSNASSSLGHKDAKYEHGIANNEHVNTADLGSLQRQLKSRHIGMISLGGIIGTGLFLGTATALENGGPLGLWLGYIFMGGYVYCVMVSLGEMIAYLPVSGGHITMATRFVDPAFGFAVGWNYWYNWAITELSASAVIIDYWDNPVPDAAWVAIVLVVTIAINVGGTRVYGELEFWFCIIKILTIVGLIIFGIVYAAGGVGNHPASGFQYWRDPGPFVQFLDIDGSWGQFLGFWSVLIQASFAYLGTEIIAICAGEAKNPRKSLPKAIKRVYIRIVFFYILGVFVIGLMVPSDDERLDLNDGTAASSPFVIAINRAQVKVLPSIINAALLTAAWSAAASDLYTASRALYGMSLTKAAPSFLSYTTSWGVPMYCIGVCVLIGLLGFTVVSASAGEVFNYFVNMSAVAGVISWVGICITYVRFYAGMKAQNFDRDTLPYKAPLQPYLGWIGVVVGIIVVLFNGFSVFMHGQWDTPTFITAYLPIPLWFILQLGYMFWNKTRFVRADEMDLYTGVRELDCYDIEDPPPRNLAEKVWNWIA